ncbi:LETM1 domain-containing protein 1 [Scaptodrosophila lebanonensis]|uniref:LETM1 domain-containing protein 1 n=1 Tax=Drosophila lebanonensis TaxID=7225 RepID=A0A6J2UGA2_DROLE|nr:LETM1 domain-containing protein 1 [Scaptodrosophila lebanonensis]
MALALRAARLTHSTCTNYGYYRTFQGRRWPQHNCRILFSTKTGSEQMQKSNYATQQQQATKPAGKPPQIKRNVAAEITSVGKVIYETGWDANKPKDLQKKDNISPPTSTSSATTTTATSSPQPDEKKDEQQKDKAGDCQKTKREQMRDNVQDYIFTRYFNYVKNYDKVLEKNFPKAMQLYRVFFDGVKDFFGDMKRFLKISRIANDSPQGIRALNRQELELYMQMPRDMMKVAPALIGCSLPMVGYAFFPLVFWYPRTFLTSHFWTAQQRSEFQSYYMKRRLQCNKPVFRCLQSKLKSMAGHHKHADFQCILGQIGSGFHPTPEALIDVKDIFAEGPYSLLGMSRKHVKCLLKLHGLPNSLFKRHRLHEHAFLVHYMDQAITREGGVHNLSVDALRYSCFLRGLNPTNLSNELMIEWLRKWVMVSTSIQAEHITLFLHLPILLGYNHPNNWQMIYGKSKA